MDSGQRDALIALIRAFVIEQDDLRGLAACGSWARGNPRPDSDLDLIILAREPDSWRKRQDWVCRIAFEQAHLRYVDHEIAVYGAAWSAHVALAPPVKLELVFVGEAWARTNPLDPGTRHVVADAFTVIVDKDGKLATLAGAVRATAST